MTYWPIDPGILLPVRRTLPQRLLVTPMEDGPPKVRRRNLGAPGTMSGDVRMTGAQFADFMAWGEGALLDWSLPFTWIDPISGLTATLQFRDEPVPSMDTSAAGGLSVAASTWTVPVSLWVTA